VDFHLAEVRGRWKIFFGSAQPNIPDLCSATRRCLRRASSRARIKQTQAKRPRRLLPAFLFSTHYDLGLKKAHLEIPFLSALAS